MKVSARQQYMIRTAAIMAHLKTDDLIRLYRYAIVLAGGVQPLNNRGRIKT
jgi:hypothetical protein